LCLPQAKTSAGILRSRAFARPRALIGLRLANPAFRALSGENVHVEAILVREAAIFFEGF
jgi:hypothetical protein